MSQINCFPWKQALCRKKLKLKIKDGQVGVAMTKLVIDVLTVVPKDEIIKKVIPYVRLFLYKECTICEDLKKWDLFWEYFVGYWCSSRCFIETWNNIDEDEVYFELQNRTELITHWRGTTVQ